MELVKTAGNEVIKSILPVIDDFERAIKSFDTSDKESLQQGIQFIYNKIKNNLGEKGLVEMNPVGEKFDPDQHEAITQLPAPSEKEKGMILDVIEKGYKLNDIIIRYPKVVVCN
jgi:molecular chaperone GrpE